MEECCAVELMTASVGKGSAMSEAIAITSGAVSSSCTADALPASLDPRVHRLASDCESTLLKRVDHDDEQSHTHKEASSFIASMAQSDLWREGEAAPSSRVLVVVHNRIVVRRK